MDTRQIRAVVIDDSVVFRSLLTEALSQLPGVRVVGFASDGKKGIEKVRQCAPDLVTLDIEMPLMNGLEALEAIKSEFPSVIVVMVSSLTRTGSMETIRALELGALDFITKPEESTPEESRRILLDQARKIISGMFDMPDLQREKTLIKTEGSRRRNSKNPLGIVGVGVSTGGPKALATLIPNLPATLPVPIVLVQHMPPLFTASLAETLRNKSKINVVEACQGETLMPGKVYIAPGGFQMGVSAVLDTGQKKITLSDDPPEHFCKPAVDYLFRSLASEYHDAAIGVILTGMGKDGALGLAMMKRCGCITIAQDQATSTVFGMPREAISAGIVDFVLPIEAIAAEIVKLLANTDCPENASF